MIMMMVIDESLLDPAVVWERNGAAGSGLSSCRYMVTDGDYLTEHLTYEWIGDNVIGDDDVYYPAVPCYI